MPTNNTPVPQFVQPAVTGSSGLFITNEDNMLLMSRYPDNYFDLAIVDPPYGLKWSNRTDDDYVKYMGKTKAFKSNMEWDEVPNNDYWNELKRVSKNQIVWGINYFSNHFDKFTPVFWDKKNGESQFSDGELCGVTIHGKSRVLSHAYIGRYHPEPKKIHPTQKPTYVYEKLLGWYAKEGFKILDTHLGSGSIAIAVDKANRFENSNLTLVACEIDKDFYNKSVQRINEYLSQQSLF
jgi:site-specific DNA-methyltransferase (adenine-specific)